MSWPNQFTYIYGCVILSFCLMHSSLSLSHFPSLLLSWLRQRSFFPSIKFTAFVILHTSWMLICNFHLVSEAMFNAQPLEHVRSACIISISHALVSTKNSNGTTRNYHALHYNNFFALVSGAIVANFRGHLMRSSEYVIYLIWFSIYIAGTWCGAKLKTGSLDSSTTHSLCGMYFAFFSHHITYGICCDLAIGLLWQRSEKRPNEFHPKKLKYIMHW